MGPLFLSLLLICFYVSSPAQPATPDSAEPTQRDFYIPAELKRSLRAEKLHPGDEVRFETLEAVLVGDGLVLPDRTKLYGHIVDVSPLQPGGSSRLAVMVEKAVWKKKVFPLRAFITGFGIRRRVTLANNQASCGPEGVSPGQTSKTGRHSLQSHADLGDCMYPSRVVDVEGDGINLQGLVLYRNPHDGSTKVVSRKKNIHLPGGTLVMLHNVPIKELRAPAIVSQK